MSKHTASLQVTAAKEYKEGTGKAWHVHNIRLHEFSSIEAFNNHLKKILKGGEPYYLSFTSDTYPQEFYKEWGICWELFEILSGALSDERWGKLSAYYALFGNSDGVSLNQLIIDSNHAHIGYYNSLEDIAAAIACGELLDYTTGLGDSTLSPIALAERFAEQTKQHGGHYYPGEGVKQFKESLAAVIEAQEIAKALNYL